MTEGKYELFKVILMIGLIITMVVLAVVLWKYTEQMKENPCEFCNEYNVPMIYGEYYGEKEYIYIPIDEVNANLKEIEGGKK